MYLYSRVLGGLLAAHLLIVDSSQPFGRLKPEYYDNELLHLAHDLVNRLLPAFEMTKTGVPWPRVSEIKDLTIQLIQTHSTKAN